MKNILEELYYGNIACNVYSPKTEEEAQRLAALSRLEDTLLNTLEGDQKEQFIDYVNLCAEGETDVKSQDFRNGFRLGAQLLLEVTTGEDGFLWEK